MIFVRRIWGNPFCLWQIHVCRKCQSESELIIFQRPYSTVSVFFFIITCTNLFDENAQGNVSAAAMFCANKNLKLLSLDEVNEPSCVASILAGTKIFEF